MLPHGGPPLQTPLPRAPSPLGALPPPAALLLRAASVRLPGYRHGAAPRPPTGGGCWDVGGRTGGRGGAVPLRRFPGRLLLLLFLPPLPVPGTRCPRTYPGGPAPPQQHGPGGLLRALHRHHRGWGTIGVGAPAAYPSPNPREVSASRQQK